MFQIIIVTDGAGQLSHVTTNLDDSWKIQKDEDDETVLRKVCKCV